MKPAPPVTSSFTRLPARDVPTRHRPDSSAAPTDERHEARGRSRPERTWQEEPRCAERRGDASVARKSSREDDDRERSEAKSVGAASPAREGPDGGPRIGPRQPAAVPRRPAPLEPAGHEANDAAGTDRKSTRLNSSH